MDVLQKIRDAGFSLWVDGGDLIISPSSKLTDEQRAYLKMHKAAVIERLKREAPLESATTSPPPDGSQPPQRYAARAFLYSVIQDGGVERATPISQGIRTEPEALAHLRERFPWLKVQWVQLITHSVCAGCQHYTGGVLCNADRSPEHVVRVGRCGRYEVARLVSEARS
jgi:hypothetical protein